MSTTTLTRPAARPLVRGDAAPLLTRLLVADTVVAAGVSLFVPKVLAGEAVTIGNLRGTALVMLLALPLLLLGERRARAGSVRGLVLWLGVDVYLAYQGVLLCFATPMNRLFLAYVGVLGLAGWTLLTLVAGIDRAVLAGRIGARAPYRLVGGFLGVVVTLNLLAWLAQAAPITWTGRIPQAVTDAGMLTSAIWVQDLALWLPLGLVVAVLAWRRDLFGGLLGTGLLCFYVLEAVSVASDQWWGSRADSSHPAVASAAVVPAALVVALVTALPLLRMLRHLDRTSTRPAGP